MIPHNNAQFSGEFLLYQTEDGRTRIERRLSNLATIKDYLIVRSEGRWKGLAAAHSMSLSHGT